MSSNFLIYYLFRLIKDGHEWQYKNLNGKGNKPKLYFSFLQIIAIFVSILFVLEEPNGLSSNATEQILSCLSIMVALFLSLILVTFEKSKQSDFEEKPPVSKLHTWNFFYQFNALTSYAILLSILVIILIIVELIFNINFNLTNYYYIDYPLWDKNAIISFICCSTITIMRICIIYYLIDFFLYVCMQYAVYTSLYV